MSKRKSNNGYNTNVNVTVQRNEHGMVVSHRPYKNGRTSATSGSFVTSATPYHASPLILQGQPPAPWDAAVTRLAEETAARQARLKAQREANFKNLPPYATLLNTQKAPQGHIGSFWGDKIGEWRINMKKLIEEQLPTENNPYIRPFKQLISAPNDIDNALWTTVRYGNIYWVNMNMPTPESYIGYYAEGSTTPTQKPYKKGGRRTKRNKRSKRSKTRRSSK